MWENFIRGTTRVKVTRASFPGLMLVLQSHGIRWLSGCRPTEFNPFGVEREIELYIGIEGCSIIYSCFPSGSKNICSPDELLADYEKPVSSSGLFEMLEVK